MQLEQRTVKDLLAYEGNARTHSRQQVGQIMDSIKAFGFCNPVLIDKRGAIIAGHGRVMAAQRLHMDTVPVIVLPHLNDAQSRALTLADNRIALNAGWDEDMLGKELCRLKLDGFDLDTLGFTTSEINLFTADPTEFTPEGMHLQGRLDERSKTRCTSCGHEFTA